MREKYIIFRFNGDNCAIQVKEVVEVVNLDKLIKTSAREVHVLYGGKQSIPVLDLQMMISVGGAGHQITDKSKIIILRHQDEKFGMLVDEVQTIVEIETEDIEEPSASKRRYIRGVIGRYYIFEPKVFLTKNKLNIFKKIYQINLENIDRLEVVSGIEPEGKDKIIRNLQLESVNMMIRTINSGVDSMFVGQAFRIHKLSNDLQKGAN